MKKENLATVTKILPNDTREEKSIYGIEEGEEQYYHSLGIGMGVNFAHCFALGAKHKENLWERVFAYKIIPNDETANLMEKTTGDKYVSVEFFELG